MKNWGIALIIAGALIATIALFIMSSTVSTEDMRSLGDYGGLIGTGTYSEIHNLPRAQMRDMVFQGGCVLFLAGVLLFGFGHLAARMLPPIEAVPVDTDDQVTHSEFSGSPVAAGLLGIVVIGGLLALALSSRSEKSAHESAISEQSVSSQNAMQAADDALNAANAADAAVKKANDLFDQSRNR